MTSVAAQASIPFDDPAAAHPDIPIQTIGGLPIAVINRARSARLMIELAAAPRPANRCPPVFTSASGQVLSMCARQADVRKLFVAADLVHAEGMPLVFTSQLLCETPLPGPVATTDLFHDVATLAQGAGMTFYFLGATDEVLRRAIRQCRLLYPRLRIIGHRNGDFSAVEESAVVDAINAARPDILWIGMDTPRELAFAIRNRHRLGQVGIIKTSGGLFDVLAGQSRAPNRMPAAALDWALRTIREPKRLARRHLLTKPHALLVLLTRTGRPNISPERHAK